MNVFDFAIRMEEDGQRFYEHLATEANQAELKSIFAMLAAAEHEHQQALERMKQSIPPAKAESKVLERVRNVFEPLLENRQALAMLTGDPDGYRHAIRFAMAGIALYEQMARKEQNPASSALLKMLAEEERQHLTIMENIYDFVQAPKDYLAWGEFSNLKEL